MAMTNCCDGDVGKMVRVHTTEARRRESLSYSGCHHSAHTARTLSNQHLGTGHSCKHHEKVDENKWKHFCLVLSGEKHKYLKST